jgi:glycosyltransferase involved in cell wall biosynthesis
VVPELSVVVTLNNEAVSLEEFYRRAVFVLEPLGMPFDLIFVDDGSLDGTFALLKRLHAGDGRVRALRLKRNFGQDAAMHAGLTRATGRVVVTMDGDLQNRPEDIPLLVAAVERGFEVASGTITSQSEPWRRAFASRLINSLLRRLTGVPVSDFGCAFNAYRREAFVPLLGAIGTQQFTKALVLSSGASVVEIEVAGRRPPGAWRSSPFSLIRLALHVLVALWPRPIQVIGIGLGVLCSLAATMVGVYGIAFWVVESDFPGPLLAGGALLAILTPLPTTAGTAATHLLRRSASRTSSRSAPANASCPS